MKVENCCISNMTDLEFTEDDIQRQLEILGYRNVPRHRLAQFAKGKNLTLLFNLKFILLCSQRCYNSGSIFYLKHLKSSGKNMEFKTCWNLNENKMGLSVSILKLFHNGFQIVFKTNTQELPGHCPLNPCQCVAPGQWLKHFNLKFLLCLEILIIWIVIRIFFFFTVPVASLIDWEYISNVFEWFDKVLLKWIFL